jgi:hypothetical protein
MADKTNLDGHNLNAARDELMGVGFRGRSYKLGKTPTQMRKPVHVGIYFITPMLLLLFLMMCTSRRQ